MSGAPGRPRVFFSLLKRFYSKCHHGVNNFFLVISRGPLSVAGARGLLKARLSAEGCRCGGDGGVPSGPIRLRRCPGCAFGHGRESVPGSSSSRGHLAFRWAGSLVVGVVLVVLIETHSLPTLVRCYPCSFTLITRTASCSRQLP
jgi:hypothetical protein